MLFRSKKNSGERNSHTKTYAVNVIIQTSPLFLLVDLCDGCHCSFFSFSFLNSTIAPTIEIGMAILDWTLTSQSHTKAIKKGCASVTSIPIYTM